MEPADRFAPAPAGPGTVPGPIHHLGYVVEDLTAAARHWHDIAAIGPFVALPHVPFDEVVVDGAPAVVDYTTAFAAYGPVFVELQLIHYVKPPSAWRRFQTAGPVGLNHVAYTSADAPLESARLAACGLPCTVRARGGELEFALHDASATLGFAVEIHRRSNFLTAFFEQVRAAAYRWDGRELIHYVAD
jgi:Glyoxalase/Bleomycin resistance protein/Dioxygenase superfamily